MSRPPNTEDRRARIVDGLIAVMADRGYEGATVHAIAAAAGLAPGLVHYHFRNKLEVLIALIEALEARVAERLHSRLARARTPWAGVEAWIDAHVALDASADPRAVACWVAVGAEALRQPDVQRAYEAALRRDLAALVPLVREAAPGREPEPLAAALLAATEGVYRVSASAPGLTPRGFAADALRRMARGLLEGAP